MKNVSTEVLCCEFAEGILFVIFRDGQESCMHMQPKKPDDACSSVAREVRFGDKCKISRSAWKK